jgi:hypothetical protein
MLDGPYRVGPWPGLTPSGGRALLGCAALLAVFQVLVGNPQRALPDLPLLGALSMAPLVLATRIVCAPGAASAVCGAYLLSRTLVSLVEPSIQPPPLLLPAALAFDVTLWLRRGDLIRLRDMWPRKQLRWRTKPKPPVRRIETWRAIAAGAAFGLTLGLVEPSYELLLGAEPSLWAGADLLRAAAATVIGCAILALGLSGRGRAS